MAIEILTLIQTRTGSTRLPGKVLKPLGKGTVLSHMLERVSASQLKGTVAVITTKESSDDPIVDACNQMDVPCFRGDTSDLLDRHYQAWKHFGAIHDAVVKIPSDCPLIDPRIIDRVVKTFLDSQTNPNDDGQTFDFVSNLHPQSYPDGNDVEVIEATALHRAWREAKKPIEREHTTPFFWDNPKRFRIGNVLWEKGIDLSKDLRWTLDYAEDYELIRKVYEQLSPTNPLFTVDQIVELLDNRPEFRAINRTHLGACWYQRHKQELNFPEGAGE